MTDATPREKQAEAVKTFMEMESAGPPMVGRVPGFTVLGVDPGTHCGWALVKNSPGKPLELVASGVWDLSARRHEGGGMRFLRLSRYLDEVFTGPEPIDAVAYEEVRRHMGTDAGHVYGGIVAVLSARLELRAIPYRGIPVATVKKVATGKGNAKKNAMIAAANALWPDFPPQDDNEADARFIAVALLKELV